MANLGTLWFGADVDLNQLKRKIQQGNQSILDALKMNYDPASYQQMVSKLRAQLANEKFEIKLSTGNLNQNVLGKGVGSRGAIGAVDELNAKIANQKALISDLEKEVARLEAAYKKMRGTSRYNRLQDAKSEVAIEKANLRKMQADQKAYNQSVRQMTAAKKQAAEAARQLNSDSIRLNTTLAGGIHISTRLGSALSGLFAVHTARQFLDNVIEIGGQLEKQRISMGAIIGDVSRANVLFEQIKNLAIKSPFGVVELDQYSKQLAAYGIEQSDLFNMTKRLADISAGAGQDISRLALALGHVKSATYLTGITLRQFSMNNIPMLKMLADYYSEVEKRAVSTAEVQKRISKRQVSYEDVVEQIKRMTDEGGQFYNMQEKISESLSAKFKNLRDSFDIMYGEIAESSIGDMLKGFAAGATDISREWRSVLAILGEAAAIFGIYKVAMGAMSVGATKLAATYGLLATRSNTLTASQVQSLAVTKQITKEQLLNAVASGRLTVEQAKLAASEYHLTEAQLQHVAASRKVDASLLRNSIATSSYTMEQLRAMATIRASSLQFNIFGKQIDFASKRFAALRVGVYGAGQAIKGMFASISSFLPYIASFAAFSLVIDTFTEQSRAAEEQEERMRSMAETANEAYKNMAKARDKFNVGASSSMTDDAIQTAMPEMVETLTNYSKVAKETFNNAFEVNSEGKAIHSLGEQYEILAKAIADTTDAYTNFNNMRPMVEHSIEAAQPDFGWVERFFIKISSFVKKKEEMTPFMDMKESLSFYAESLREASKAEQLFLRNRQDIVNALKGVGESNADNLSNEQLLELISNIKKDYPSVFDAFTDKMNGEVNNAMENMIDKWDVLSIAYQNASDRMSKAGQDFYQSAKVQWGSDMQKWPVNWKNVVMLAMEEAIKGVKGFEDMSAEAQANIRNIWLKPFGITVDTKEASKQVNNLLVELQNLVGADWTVQIGIKGVSAIDDLDNANKSYKKAVESLRTLEKNKKNLENKGETHTDAYKKLVEEEKEMIAARDAASSIITHYGGELPYVKEKKNGPAKQADEWLKRMREQLKELENFYRVYQRNAKYMSKDDAIQKALDSDVFKGKNMPKNIDDYLKVLNNFRKKVEAEIGRNPSTERKSFLTELLTKIDEKSVEVKFKEVFEKASKEMQEYISKQSEKWNLYKALFEKTGDKNFAQNAFRDGTVWDEYTQQLADKLRKQISGSGKKIDVSSLLNMTSENAQEMLKGVEGGYELWKQITDLIRKNYVEVLRDGADAMAKDYTITEKIRAEEERIAELRRKRGKSDDADTQDAYDYQIKIGEKNLEKLQYEQFMQSSQYLQFFGAVLTMTNQEMEEAAQIIRDRLIVELSRGNITSRQYVKNLKDVNEQLSKGRTAFKGDFMTFISGGQEGIVELRQQEATNAAIAYELAKKHREELEKLYDKDEQVSQKELEAANKDEDEAKKRLEAAAKALGVSTKMLTSLSKMSSVLQVISGVFDGLQSAANSLAEMFEALGKDGVAAEWSDISDTIGAVSSVLKPVNNLVQNAMNGNVSGIVSSAISAPVDLFTGPITAFAKLHDKKLQREIEASQQRQREMENLTKNLQTVLQRTLGGIYNFSTSQDTSAFRREYNEKVGWRLDRYNKGAEMVAQSADMEGFAKELFAAFGKSLQQSAGSNELLDALKKAESTQEYYDMQKAMLMLQQDELRQQLEAEADKKDSDDAAMENYRQQIKELDDEIKNFALDMAKALWDIDLQSWATELTEAIVNAWENGENAAEAYKSKVKSIMKDLTQNILVKRVMENMFEQMGLDDLIANMMDATSGKLNYNNVTALAEKLYQVGESTTNVITSVLDEMERNGYIEKENNGSTSTSSTIKGITENTADLLAAYLNAIRADVSIMRNGQTIYLPSIVAAVQRTSVLAQTQVTLQEQIAENTKRNADTAEQIYNILRYAQNGAIPLSVK